MAESPTASSTMTSNMAKSTKNTVPEMIQKIAAAKATGKFTFQAGRMDAAVNMLIGGVFIVTMLGCGQGAYHMATGKGKAD